MLTQIIEYSVIIPSSFSNISQTLSPEQVDLSNTRTKLSSFLFTESPLDLNSAFQNNHHRQHQCYHFFHHLRQLHLFLQYWHYKWYISLLKLFHKLFHRLDFQCLLIFLPINYLDIPSLSFMNFLLPSSSYS